MTDFASLALSIDSTGVKTGVSELDKLTAAGTRAEGAVDNLGDTAAATGTQMRGAGRAAAEMAAEAQTAARGLTSTAAASGSAKAGMQQLGYQLGDAATMFSMGSSAAQVFGSQLGQTLQAVQLMSGGTSGLAAFLGGPWGIALSVAAIALAPLISKLWEADDALDEVATSAANAMAKLRQSVAQASVTTEAASTTTAAMIGEMGKLGGVNKDIAQTNGLIKAMSSNTFLAAANAQALGAQYQRLSQLEAQRAEIQKKITGYQGDIDQIRTTASVTLMQAEAQERLNGSTAGGAVSTARHTGATRTHTAAAKQQKAAVDEVTAAIDRMRGVLKDATLATLPSAAAGFTAMQDELADNLRTSTQGYIDTAEANARWNDQLRETITMLDQMGGFGRTLGDLGAVFEALSTGNFTNVGGGLGTLGKFLFTDTDQNGNRFVNKLGLEFKDSLNSVFGDNFAANFSDAMGAFGAAVEVNKMIGDIFGFEGGPLGILPALFKTTTKGYAVVSNKSVTSGGTNDGLAASSAASGGAIQGAIQSIADQLGGTVGDYSVSIGKRSSGYISVSGSGSANVADKSWKKANAGGDMIYDGKDEAEALRVAVLNAIQDGAIQGVRAGTQALLSKSGDIETQLSKALQFEGVFTALKQATDPLGSALETVNKQFDKLRTIFAEAGATAAEYAQLEQLLALERAKAAEQAQSAIVDKVRDSQNLEIKLLDLLGRGEDALAASRLLELAGLKASLQPLQAMVYQLEDARGVIDTFQPLADDLRKYRAELLGGDASSSFGFLQSQFRSTAALAASGDATAMAGLRASGSSYLTAAKDNASSYMDYQRTLGEVLSAVDKGIFAADTQVDYAQAQIDAINNTANIIEKMRAEMATYQAQIAEDTAFTRKLWSRFEGDGLTIKTDSTEPLQVQVVA